MLRYTFPFLAQNRQRDPNEEAEPPCVVDVSFLTHEAETTGTWSFAVVAEAVGPVHNTTTLDVVRGAATLTQVSEFLLLEVVQLARRDPVQSR